MEFLPLVVLALLFWFLIIRPQRRRGQRQAQLIASLEPGQEVLTSAGFYGRIHGIEGDEVRLELAPGTVVRVDRRAIASRVDPGDPG
jgi:preprotein translocase subunit YajC